MTKPEQAAERLRRYEQFGDDTESAEYEVYDDDHNGPFNDMATLSEAYLRETDPRPVDEDFAKSVAVEVWSNTAGRHFDIQKGAESAVLLKASDKWLLIIISDVRERNCCVNNPTIGQFWSCCRIFGVKVKGA